MADATWFEGIAQGLLAILTGLSLVLGVVWGKGKANSKPEAGGLEVAGALVSDTQAKGIIAALHENTAAMNRNTEAALRVHDSADDLKLDMRDLRLELRHGKT
ncbi:hypothetical protein [Loktanella sp. R86503]|uniref:hypothetical protein n=1 Tax=Loktanella sp. R86503 TaxID=3093847 RepID=UPI0036DA006B